MNGKARNTRRVSGSNNPMSVTLLANHSFKIRWAGKIAVAKVFLFQPTPLLCAVFLGNVFNMILSTETHDIESSDWKLKLGTSAGKFRSEDKMWANDPIMSFIQVSSNQVGLNFTTMLIV